MRSWCGRMKELSFWGDGLEGFWGVVEGLMRRCGGLLGVYEGVNG